MQISFNSDKPIKAEKLKKLDKAIDSIRERYGEDSVQRACFVNSRVDHMSGGLNKAKRGESTE